MYKYTHNLSEVTSVILAGGLGTRLRPVVPDTPKVLSRVCNRPFITFLLDQLISAGAKEVVLCTGYKGQDVFNELGSRYKSLNLRYSLELEPIGTGGALRLALPLIKTDTVLVMNGDSYAHAQLDAYLDWFFKNSLLASLLLVNVTNSARYGKVSLDSSGKIIAFEEKTLDSSPGLVNGGIYIFKRSLLKTIPEDTPYSLEHQFFTKLMKEKLWGFISGGKFIDIGTPDSFKQAQVFFDNFGSQKNRIHT